MLLSSLVVIIVIAAILGIWAIQVSNKVNRAILKIDEAKAAVEIQLKKRYEVLAQSMEVAKGFAKHETEVFINLRAVTSGMSTKEINEVINNQTQAMQSLLALGEAYPELKSAQLFSNLQGQLSEENAQFAAAKRACNSNIISLNNLVVSFPSSIVCSMKGQSKEEFLHEDNVGQYENVKLSWEQSERTQ